MCFFSTTQTQSFFQLLKLLKMTLTFLNENLVLTFQAHFTPLAVVLDLVYSRINFKISSNLFVIVKLVCLIFNSIC